MKAKVIVGNPDDSLESQLNNWLGEHPKAEIKHIGQSESSSGESDRSATIVILFDEPNRWAPHASK